MSQREPMIEIPATITERGQTTVPAVVRRMLGLGKSGRIVFRGLADGTVVIANAASAPEVDPALRPFLALLEQDLAARPEALVPVSGDLVARARLLVENVEVELDAALPDA